jgi:hypothetical protein
MDIEHLFTQARGLTSPWKVVSCDFDPFSKSLELSIDFERGSRFPILIVVRFVLCMTRCSAVGSASIR